MRNLWFTVVCSSYILTMHSNIIDELENIFNFNVPPVLLPNNARSKATVINSMQFVNL